MKQLFIVIILVCVFFNISFAQKKTFLAVEIGVFYKHKNNNTSSFTNQLINTQIKFGYNISDEFSLKNKLFYTNSAVIFFGTKTMDGYFGDDVLIEVDLLHYNKFSLQISSGFGGGIYYKKAFVDSIKTTNNKGYFIIADNYLGCNYKINNSFELNLGFAHNFIIHYFEIEIHNMIYDVSPKINYFYINAGLVYNF